VNTSKGIYSLKSKTLCLEALAAQEIAILAVVETLRLWATRLASLEQLQLPLHHVQP